MKRQKIFVILSIFITFIFSSIKTVESATIPDVVNFFGERISLSQPQSSKIGKIHLDIQLPDDYKLLPKANSQVHLFTLDGQFSKKFPLKKTSVVIPINREVRADKLYVELALYYCKEGKEGLCLIKKVLFDMPIQKSNNTEEFILNYQLPEVTQ